MAVRYEIDDRYPRLVVRKIRPVWQWEREVKWSAPETGVETCMEVWQQPTMGM